MHPVLFYLGPYPVFAYGVFILLGLGVLFVGACFGWIAVLLVFGWFGEVGALIGTIGGMLVFLGLFLWGFFYLAGGVWDLVQRWWSPPPDPAAPSDTQPPVAASEERDS